MVLEEELDRGFSLTSCRTTRHRFSPTILLSSLRLSLLPVVVFVVLTAAASDDDDDDDDDGCRSLGSTSEEVVVGGNKLLNAYADIVAILLFLECKYMYTTVREYHMV